MVFGVNSPYIKKTDVEFMVFHYDMEFYFKENMFIGKKIHKLRRGLKNNLLAYRKNTYNRTKTFFIA